MKKHFRILIIMSLPLLFLSSCKEKIDNEDGPSGLPPTNSPFGKGAAMVYSTFDFSLHCAEIQVTFDTLSGTISGKSTGTPDCGSSGTAFFAEQEGGGSHFMTATCGSLIWFWESANVADPCYYYPLSYASQFPGEAVLSVFVKEYNLPNPMNLMVSVDGSPIGIISQTVASAYCGEPGTVSSYGLSVGSHYWEVRDLATNAVFDTIVDFSEGCNLWFFNKWE